MTLSEIIDLVSSSDEEDGEELALRMESRYLRARNADLTEMVEEMIAEARIRRTMVIVRDDAIKLVLLCLATMRATVTMLISVLHLSTPASDTRLRCIVCMTAARKVALVPCVHYILCGDCCTKVMACPLCRHPIANALVIYD